MSLAATASPQLAAQRTSFSLEHYEHMVAVGAFAGEHERSVELLWGEITDMAPVGPPHSDDVDVLTQWSFAATADKPIRVRTQQPIRLPGSNSQPEPDVAWVVEQSYRDRHPNPDEVLLVIEVADTSLEVDRGAKLAAYAQAGIAEYWIVNLPERCVEVCRSPKGHGYADRKRVKPGDQISPLAYEAAQLDVARLFP